jgi:hypothetical protein
MSKQEDPAMPIGQHVTLRLADDRVIAPETADRRRLAGVIAKAARPFRLLAFSAAGAPPRHGARSAF